MFKVGDTVWGACSFDGRIECSSASVIKAGPKEVRIDPNADLAAFGFATRHYHGTVYATKRDALEGIRKWLTNKRESLTREAGQVANRIEAVCAAIAECDSTTPTP